MTYLIPSTSVVIFFGFSRKKANDFELFVVFFFLLFGRRRNFVEIRLIRLNGFMYFFFVFFSKVFQNLIELSSIYLILHTHLLVYGVCIY